MKTLMVFGTRPEAIKMVSIYEAARQRTSMDMNVCLTGQHRDMVDPILSFFGIVPDHDLNIMKEGQSLVHITTSVLSGVYDVIEADRPDIVLVQGDTTSSFAAALAAFYHKVPVGHVEAGLRTGDIYSPWPEEVNRRLVSEVARYHFAPTPSSRGNLVKENVAPDRIFVTGNTVIDTLLDVNDHFARGSGDVQAITAQFDFLDPDKKLIVVTAHRRESFGEGFRNICAALAELAERDDVELCYPVHRNPNVRDVVTEQLEGKANVHLVAPLDYLPFVYLMTRAHIILTDSGGVQEEAPSLGKPVFVMRDTTERPEAITAGTVKLVGTDRQAIVSAATAVLDDAAAYRAMSQAVNPYGDGKCAGRILDVLEHGTCEEWTGGV